MKHHWRTKAASQSESRCYMYFFLVPSFWEARLNSGFAVIQHVLLSLVHAEWNTQHFVTLSKLHSAGPYVASAHTHMPTKPISPQPKTRPTVALLYIRREMGFAGGNYLSLHDILRPADVAISQQPDGFKVSFEPPYQNWIHLRLR